MIWLSCTLLISVIRGLSYGLAVALIGPIPVLLASLCEFSSIVTLVFISASCACMLANCCCIVFVSSANIPSTLFPICAEITLAMSGVSPAFLF